MELTKRQAEVLDTIAQFQAEHGYAPTLREMLPLLGLTSTNGIKQHLTALERKGKLIGGDFAKGRTLKVVPTPDHEKRLDVPVKVGERVWILSYSSGVFTVFRKRSAAQEMLDRADEDGMSVCIHSALIGAVSDTTVAYDRKKRVT